MFNPIGVASWNLRFKPLPYVELPVGLNEMEACIMKDKGRFWPKVFSGQTGGPGGSIFAWAALGRSESKDSGQALVDTDTSRVWSQQRDEIARTEQAPVCETLH